MRWLILVHRYIGIAIGWLLVLWCLSGVVMMYVGYPEVTREEALAVLPTLDWGRCCAFDNVEESIGGTALADLSVEMLGNDPVLRARSGFGRPLIVNLRTGEPVGSIDAGAAMTIAERLFAAAGIAGSLEYLGANEIDQWTVSGSFGGDRPLHHFALNDEAGTQWYVSSSSGSLVQATTRLERGWNWVGAVVHWSYPTMIRQDTALWIQVIIWTTLIGTFMTVVGLFIGISRIKRRRSGRWSPYRGIAWWHHWLGIVFGALALTWIFSGLLSVNPWGWLEGSSGRREALDVQGAVSTWSSIRPLLEQLAGETSSSTVVRIEAAPFNGELFALIHDRKGGALRLSLSSLKHAPLGEDDLHAIVPRLLDGGRALAAELIHTSDNYYFNHHTTREFPVFRVIAGDGTRYYLSALSGRLVQKTDSGRRWYRWLFEGIHRFDFTPILRRRPFWDTLMLLLLAGVTAVCATGTYMGFRYLARKL
jgi:hypothetical protein